MMRYQVFLKTDRGELSPHGPTAFWASGIVDAQRKAQAVLEACQRDKALLGWTIDTVVETL